MKSFHKLPEITILLLMLTAILAACSTLGNPNGGEEATTTTELVPLFTTVETTEPLPTDTPTPTSTPTPTPPPQHINVSFIGDCTLAEALAWNGDRNGFDAVINGDYNYCFQNAVDVLSQDDMTLANFEGTLTDATSHQIKEFVFGSPAEYAEILVNGSVECVNLSNNHSSDYWSEGLTDTQENLDSYGIVWSNQYTVSTYEVNGILIGMCGIDMIANGDTASTAYPLIDQLKDMGCNIIIVSAHWGVERDYSPRDTQVTTAHALIDYGADIVVGHHPHRLQPIEMYNGKPIFYSLSNFCFGGNTGLSDPDSAIVQCEFIMDETNTFVESYRLNVIPYCQTSTRPGNDYCPIAYEWGSEDYLRVMGRLNWNQEDE